MTLILASVMPRFAVLANDPQTSPAPAAAVVAKICDALGTDVASGRLSDGGHLTPSAVRLGPDGTVHIAGTDHPERGKRSITEAFGYLAPEQVEGKEVDQRSDVFTCGTFLYELLTGKNPFAGDTRSEIVSRIKSAAILPPSSVCPQIDEAMDAIALMALKRDRNKRHDNPAELSSR